MFIIAPCKAQTVGLEKHSKAFDSEALSSSSLRRIQRFIADFILDADLIAKMKYSLLHEKENLNLCIHYLTADREFIGNTWIKYLNGRKIRYYIHIKNTF